MVDPVDTSSTMINSGSRDVKIRKLNPSVGKGGGKHKSNAQQIHNMSQQAYPSSTNTRGLSPITKMSMNSQNLFTNNSNAQSQFTLVPPPLSRRLVDGDQSAEFPYNNKRIENSFGHESPGGKEQINSGGWSSNLVQKLQVSQDSSVKKSSNSVIGF